MVVICMVVNVALMNFLFLMQMKIICNKWRVYELSCMILLTETGKHEALNFMLIGH